MNDDYSFNNNEYGSNNTDLIYVILYSIVFTLIVAILNSLVKVYVFNTSILYIICCYYVAGYVRKQYDVPTKAYPIIVGVCLGVGFLLSDYFAWIINISLITNILNGTFSITVIFESLIIYSKSLIPFYSSSFFSLIFTYLFTFVCGMIGYKIADRA